MWRTYTLIFLACVRVVELSDLNPRARPRHVTTSNTLRSSSQRQSPEILQQQESEFTSGQEVQLLQWLRQRGGGASVHAEIVNGLRGLVADHDAKVGDVLLEVPLALTISDIDESDSARLAGSAPSWSRKLPCYAQLALAVTDRSIDDPYTKTWPSKPLPLPHRCQEKELELLSDHYIQTKVDEDFFSVTNMYWDAQDVYNTAVDSNELLSSSFPTFDQFKDAWQHVRSRCLRLSCGKHGVRRLLVPYLDLANHEDVPAAIFDYSSSADAVRLYAARPLKAGEEVTLTYCAESNEHFALYYGFIPAYNPFNAVAVTLGDVLSVLPQESVYVQPEQEWLEQKFKLYDDGGDFELLQVLADLLSPGKSPQGTAARAVALVAETIEKSLSLDVTSDVAACIGVEAVRDEENLLSTPGVTEQASLLIRLRLSRRRLLMSLREMMLRDAELYDANPRDAGDVLAERIEVAARQRTAFPFLKAEEVETWGNRTWNWSSANWD